MLRTRLSRADFYRRYLHIWGFATEGENDKIKRRIEKERKLALMAAAVIGGKR
jgi:hypothetical protein